MVTRPAQRGTGGAGTGRRRVFAAVLAALLAVALAACGGSAEKPDGSKITVAYKQFGGNPVYEQFLGAAKTEFEKANPGTTVNLQPITASDATTSPSCSCRCGPRAPRPTWSTRTPSRSTPTSRPAT
ncbi:MAG TPA: hypothetical protein VH008_20930 [Pseudonocardia sp.]|nr:hypothetical protein [Pseudonocardia sp.]